MNRIDNMHSPRVLVTGGAGYVGSVVVDELLARGFEVRVLDSLVHGVVPSLLLAWGNPRFEFVRADVRDRQSTAKALEGVSACVHLAAVVGDPACARQPDLARDVNLAATRQLVSQAEEGDVRRFVFASTCSNYGKLNGGGVATEDFPLNPVSLYAETKVAAEHDVIARSNGNLATCCLRFATVFGTSPRMRFDLTVNEFTRDILLADELVVYGEQFWRPYVHVRDVARAVAMALETDDANFAGQVFNVGDSAENYRKLDIVELLRERFPSAEVRFVQKDEDPRDYRVSFDKFRSSTGFAMEHSVGDGIDEVAELLQSGLLEDPYAPMYRN